MDNLQVYATAIGIREKQLALESSNITNRDTPNYKAKDISFSRVMDDAIKTQFSGTPKLDNYIEYRGGITAKADNNTVNSSLENSKFSEHSMQYKLALEMMSSEKDSRLKAIRGK